MRLFGLDINMAAAGPTQSDPKSGSSGIDGDSPFADIVAGGFDRTPELSGHNKYIVLDEMRKTDAMIRSILYMYKLPIRSADWGLVAQADDPDAVIRDAVAKQFGLEDNEGHLDLTWGEWLSQSMLMLDFGAMFEEIVWGDSIELWDLGPGPTGVDRAPVLIRPIQRFAPRFPSTIDEIRGDSKTGRLVSIRQGRISNGQAIPAEVNGVLNVIPYVHEREGNNWFGTSLLRAMFGPWKLKKALLIAAGVGWDRYSSGVPVVRYPKGSGANAKREAQQIARSYRTHERAWVTFEGDATEGWSIDIVNGQLTLADPTPLIAMYDEQMATAALQIFSRLGTSHHGSRAVGQVLADPYYLAIMAYASDLAKQRERTAFRTFVDVNFGTGFKVPKLHVSKVQPENILTLSQAMYYLSQAGLNFTDRDTQNDIRDQMDLRHLPLPVQAAIDSLPDDVGVEDPTIEVDPFDVPAPGGGVTPQLAASGYVQREGDGLGY